MRRRLLAAFAALVLALVGTVVLVAYVRAADARALAGVRTVDVLVVRQPVAEGTPAADLAASVEVTPHRTVVVPDLPDESAAVLLAAAGLVPDPGSPWTRVTACAGRPGCAKSLADVRADVTTAIATGSLPAGGARQHWAGCARRCGRPQGGVVDVVATPAGYLIEKD